MYGLFEQIVYVKEELLSSGGMLNTFVLIACSIGLITSALYIFANTAEAQINGQGVNLWNYFRPFVVGFCILSFPLLVTILDGLSSGTSRIISMATDEFKQESKRLKKQLREDERAYYDGYMASVPGYEDSNSEDNTKTEQGLGLVVSIAGAGTQATDIVETDPQRQEGALSSLWDKVDNALQSANDAIGGFFTDTARTLNTLSARVITRIIYSIAAAASPIIKALAAVYLIILSLVGPVVFAIGIAPSLTSSISSWFARYIQISLWLPLSDLITYIIRAMEVVVLKAHQAHTVGGIVYYPDDAMTLISIISIAAIFKVPTIAGWIISSAGAGSMSASINKTTQAAASAIARKLIFKV